MSSSLAESLRALQRATHRTLQTVMTQLVDLDLSASEINALANLADGKGRTVSQLAAAVGVRPTTLTGVLDRLERRGLVDRANPPGDRRTVMITLTDAGSTVAKVIEQAYRRVAGKALRSLSSSELAGFHAGLAALSDVR